MRTIELKNDTTLVERFPRVPARRHITLSAGSPVDYSVSVLPDGRVSHLMTVEIKGVHYDSILILEPKPALEMSLTILND